MSANTPIWQQSIDDKGIIWLSIDDPAHGTNILSLDALNELNERLVNIKQSPKQALGVIFNSNKENGFIAGADIDAFTRIKDRDEAMTLIHLGQQVMQQISDLPIPTLALLHGFALGGGLELALACNYRLSSEDARLGLPEIQLGIFPGFGGTARLIQLLGPLKALQLMLSGREVKGKEARKLGLVDQVVPKHLHRGAATDLLLSRTVIKRYRGWQRLLNLTPMRQLMGYLLKGQLSRKISPAHYPAPFSLLSHWSSAGGTPSALIDSEACRVTDLIQTPTARNLIRTFKLQQQLKGLGSDEARDIQHLHIVGGGVMGGDIAIWSALQGFTVTVQDRHHETLSQVLKRAEKLIKRRRLSRYQRQSFFDRLIPDIGGEGIKHADLLIEAISENLQIKQSLMREVEPQLKPSALLATNTSSIPLEQIASVLQHPGRFIGLHFFNPVARMQLVEVVSGKMSHKSAIKRGYDFVKQLRRLPLPVRSSPGFLVNRILMPYLMEAILLAEEGVSILTIDKAALEFGMPMGPIRLADSVGLDICLSVASVLTHELGGVIPERLKEMVNKGNIGRKSGRGFYRYSSNGELLKPVILGDKKPPQDLSDRLILSMINESLACLREGVVENRDFLDAGVIFATGFAPFRGGPMQYLHDNFNNQRAHMQSLQQHHGDRFHLDSGWRTLSI